MKPLDKNATVQITLGTLITLTKRGEDCEQYERWYREEKLAVEKLEQELDATQKALEGLRLRAVSEKVPFFENALEKAALVILNYQKYVDTCDNDISVDGKSRDDYLRQARVYEENFKELIKEIKQVKDD